MRIKAKKTKAMVISIIEGKKVKIKTVQHKVEQVQKLKYLGALVTEDVRCLFVCLFVCFLTAHRHSRVISVPFNAYFLQYLFRICRTNLSL